MRPDLAIMYFEYCLEELPLDEDERACYELAIEVLKRQESVVRELEEERAIAFVTLANSGNEALDKAWEYVSTYLDKAIEIVKGGRNAL